MMDQRTTATGKMTSAVIWLIGAGIGGIVLASLGKEYWTGNVVLECLLGAVIAGVFFSASLIYFLGALGNLKREVRDMKHLRAPRWVLVLGVSISYSIGCGLSLLLSVLFGAAMIILILRAIGLI